MSKQTRKLAAKYAAQCWQGQGIDIAQVWATMVIFENYIDLGAEKAQEMHKIAEPATVTKFEVVK